MEFTVEQLPLFIIIYSIIEGRESKYESLDFSQSRDFILFWKLHIDGVAEGFLSPFFVHIEHI